MIKLTVVFETNLNSNAERKHEKYRDLSLDFHNVKFITLSLSALGIFSKSSEPFVNMCKELEFDKQHTDLQCKKYLQSLSDQPIIYSVCVKALD